MTEALPYFQTPERVENLRERLGQWIGTPYRHHCGVKGLGVDCIHFVARILEELGLLTWRKDLIPDYPKDWHLHNETELLAERIESELKVEKVSLGELMDGDIVMHHFGRACSHAGFYLEGFIFHAIDRAGVIKTYRKDPLFLRHAQFAYRLLE